MSMVRRTFLRRSAIAGGALAAAGPLGALTARTAAAAPPPSAAGYGPLVPKGDLALPAEFNYQIVSRQGVLQRDGEPTPGIFDGMGAFPDVGGNPSGNGDRVVLIRNHENRRRPGEIRVTVPPGFAYDEDPTYNGGCTKLVVEREPAGRDPATGAATYTYRLVDSFNILGGTDTNCAGGELPFKKWVTCEEVVNRGASGKKHGYIFEIDAMADGPVPAVPVPQAGRFEHEAVAWVGAVLYETEDRRIEPDNDDDTKNRRDRVAGFTPTRIQAQDKGAAVFDRQEGIWVGASGSSAGGQKVYFDCTEGGPNNLGQVWEYDPGRETITLIFQSPSVAVLENPDNVTIVPQTQDILLCEDSPGTQFIRGVTRDGEIYDFAQTLTNDTEFCGACFDPDGRTLYVNQQGERLGENEPPQGAPPQRAVTYAIYGPFERRIRPNHQNFGNRPGG